MTSPTNDGNGRGGWLLARPLASMAALEVFFVAVIAGGALVFKALLPRLPGYSVTGLSHALLITCINAILILGLIGALRWWRATGFTRLSEWRDLRLYWLPGLLILAPFVAGVKMPTAATLGLLIVAYLLSCVFEEGLFRGVALVVLRPLGMWPAVLISSFLFGLTHMSNQLLRGVSFLIVLQAFGAAVQGIGYAALRLRTNTICPLIVVHALHDVTLQMGHLPIALVEAPIDTILAIYGVILLRGRRRDELLPPVTTAQGAHV